MNHTCRIVRKEDAKTKAVIPNAKVDFQSELPYSIKHEIDIIRHQTERDNREKSLTMCELNDKLFIGNYARGGESSTEVLPCHKKYGKNAKQIGDIHTHPFNNQDTIGLTPSEADLVENITASFKSGIPQISCIVGAGKKGFLSKSNHVHCFQPKPEAMEDAEKVKKYNRAYNLYPNIGNNVHPYFRENVGKDFIHIWYKNGKAIPKDQEASFEVSKDIFNETVGLSKKRLRMEDVRDMEKGSFCDLIQDYNMPDNNNIGLVCRNELAKRNILGYDF